nr:hypothetical protein BaRGS_011563 [Batillaria attramentaria]
MAGPAPLAEALETVYRILEPLITYLDDQAKQTDPKAAGLRSKIATEKFVSMTYILMDVIPIIGKLNLFFQKENVDVALIQVKVDHCISDLEKLLEEDGFHQQKLNKDLDTDAHIYNGANGQYPVTGCPADQITSTKTQFIQQLIQNIQSRFQEDCDLLAAFGVLGMRPLSVLSKAELKTWGNKDIQRLTDHFGEEQVHEYMEDKVKMQAKSKPILCAMSAQAEWRYELLSWEIKR